MGYGMRGHDLCSKRSFEGFCKAVKELGVTDVQLAFKKSITDIKFDPGMYSPGLGNYLKRTLDKYGVHVAVLGCYINPTNPIEEKRQAEVAKFIEHLKYARTIGADMVGTETGRFDPNLKLNPATYTEAGYQLLLKSMREIVSAAEKLGVIVGVEGVATHTLYSPEMMLRFLRDIDSPNVEVILDPVNLLDGKNYKDQDKIINRAFELYSDKISVIHMKDFKVENGEVKFEHIGDGLLNYIPTLTNLKTKKPHITMLLECSTPERFHSDCEYLQKIYDSIETE